MVDLNFHDRRVQVNAQTERVQQTYSCELVNGDRVVDKVRIQVRDSSGKVLFHGYTVRGQFRFVVDFSVGQMTKQLIRVDVKGANPESFEMDCELDDEHPDVKELIEGIAERVRRVQGAAHAKGRYPWYKATHRGHNVLPAGEIVSRMGNLGVDPNDVFESSLLSLKAMDMPERLRVASNGAREFRDPSYWKGVSFPFSRKIIEYIEREFLDAERRGDPERPTVEIQDHRLLKYGGLGMAISTVSSVVDLTVNPDLLERVYVSPEQRFSPVNDRSINTLAVGLPDQLQASWNQFFPGGEKIPKSPSEARKWFRLALARIASASKPSSIGNGLTFAVVPQFKHKRGKVNGTLFTAERGDVASVSPETFLFHLAQVQAVHGRSLPSSEVLSRTGFVALNGFTHDGGMMTADVKRNNTGFSVDLSLEHPGAALGIYEYLDLATDALFKGFLAERREQMRDEHDTFMDGQRVRRIAVQQKIESVKRARAERKFFTASLIGLLIMGVLAGGGTNPKQLEDKKKK